MNSNPRPIEDMSQEEQDKWLEEHGFCKNGYIECKSTDALNVLSYKDNCHNIPGQFSIPYDEVEDYLVVDDEVAEELEEIPEEEQKEERDDPLSDETVREILHLALNELPERQALAIRLVILGGLTQVEAATEMGISKQAVNKLITKGIQNLREYCEMLGGADLSNVL